MSKYTTEVRFICETYAGLDESVGYSSVDAVINDSVNKVFDFDFPIFDEAYRLPLEKKILKHFYTREICEETVGLWKLRLSARLNEIMPYYNQLYTSQTIEFNPLYDIDYSRTHNLQRVGTRNSSTDSTTETSGNETANGTSSVETSNTNKDRYSDTPQGALTNVDNDTYLTSARKVTDDGSTDTSVHNTTTRSGEESGSITFKEDIGNVDNYVEHVAGRMGSNANKLLKEYRANMINIDVLVLRDLNDLFFMLW